MTKRIIREEGLFVGHSSGAPMVAALRIADRMTEGVIVVMFPDGGDRYLSREVWAMYLTQKAVDTIVRSRIDCGAYFSRMDREVQTVFGEPELPEALHVVVSVYEKQVLEITGYLWDAARQDFVTIKVKWYTDASVISTSKKSS